MTEKTVKSGGEEVPDQFPHVPLTFAPALEFATIFADGVTGVFWNAGVMKIYFSRTDGEVFGRTINPAHISPVGQIFMPLSGFAVMTAFFESQMKQLLEKGQFPREEYQKMREQFPNLSDKE